MVNIVENVKQLGHQNINREFGDERHYWSLNGKPLCNDNVGEVFSILNKMAEKFGVVFEERTESSVKLDGFMNIRIFFEVDYQRRDPDELRYECDAEPERNLT